MKVAIMSDSHDNIWNLEKVLKQIKGKTDAIIHCGDFCAPFVAAMISKLNVPVYACLGNVDGDQDGLVQLASDNFHLTPLFEEFGKVELDKRKIAFCHYPKLAELIAKSNEYDAVFYGHSHTSKIEKINNTLLLNPGAVCGITAGVVLGFEKKHRAASYAVYDTHTSSAEIIKID